MDACKQKDNLYKEKKCDALSLKYHKLQHCLFFFFFFTAVRDRKKIPL